MDIVEINAWYRDFKSKNLLCTEDGLESFEVDKIFELWRLLDDNKQTNHIHKEIYWFFVFCKKFNKYLKVTGFWSCGWNYQECMKVFRLIYHRNHLISQIWNTAHTKIFWQGDPKRMRFQIKWLHWFDRVFFYIIFFVKKITQFLCELISYSLDGRIQCSIRFRLITSRQPCIV